MTGKEEFEIWFEEAKTKIVTIDVATRGPVPDDPKEAYMRGIEAGMTLIALWFK